MRSRPYVGLALIWGAVFFGETVDTVAALGIALIVVAGILAVRGRPSDAAPYRKEPRP